jgi:hypothetical protein
MRRERCKGFNWIEISENRSKREHFSDAGLGLFFYGQVLFTSPRIEFLSGLLRTCYVLTQSTRARFTIWYLMPHMHIHLRGI